MKKRLCSVFSVGMFSLVCFGAMAPVAASAPPVSAPSAETPTDTATGPLCGWACIRAGGDCCGTLCC